jgi:hypothetical protein
MYFRPQVGYSIPVLSLTEAECEHIQSPAINAVLPKIHLNRKTARAIVFGPKNSVALVYHIFILIMEYQNCTFSSVIYAYRTKQEISS